MNKLKAFLTLISMYVATVVEDGKGCCFGEGGH